MPWPLRACRRASVDERAGTTPARRRRTARRRPLAFPARPDRLHRRRRRRGRAPSPSASSAPGCASRACSTSWSPSCRCCAPTSSRRRRCGIAPRGPVARRMVAACRPHAADGRFITAMAAVAGSVAEELIAVFARPAHRARLRQQRRRHRAAPRAGRVVRGRPVSPIPARGLRRRRRSTAASRSTRHRRCAASPPPAGAAAASRSASPTASPCSRRRASAADAAATMIANAVDVDDPRHRPRAGELDPRRQRPRRAPRHPRTCRALPERLRRAALDAGAAEARAQIARRAHHRGGARPARSLARRRHVRPILPAASTARRPHARARRRRIAERSSKVRHAAIPPPPHCPRSTSASSSARSRTSGTTTARAWPRRCGAAASPRW